MNLYDLALCLDNNDNHMTFVGHILLGPQINYMPDKSHVIVSLVSMNSRLREHLLEGLHFIVFKSRDFAFRC